MADYPATLPNPDSVSYSGGNDSGVIRTDLSVQDSNQQKVFNAQRMTVSMQFSMDNDTYTQWDAWTRANAWNWFTMNLVSSAEQTGLLSEQTVKFTGDVGYSKQGDNWLTVSVSAEILPEHVTNIELLADTQKAGNPAAPALDRVIAGSPASPATDRIAPHIYRY